MRNIGTWLNTINNLLLQETRTHTLDWTHIGFHHEKLESTRNNGQLRKYRLNHNWKSSSSYEYGKLSKMNPFLLSQTEL